MIFFSEFTGNKIKPFLRESFPIKVNEQEEKYDQEKEEEEREE